MASVKRVAKCETPRYYLHGDKVEAKVGVYYCGRCDEFVGKGHFFVGSWHCDGKHDDDGWFRRSKARYYRDQRLRRKEGLPLVDRRAKDAPNVFE